MEQTYQEYTYQALPNAADCIRLLCLLSPHPDFDGKLLGCLLLCPRDSTLVYDTLSYTWGEQEPTSEILLHKESKPDLMMANSNPVEWQAADMRRMPIRPNLETALREFQPKQEKTFGFLWIDAICINQQDDHEKAQQVRHMDRVYRG